MHVDLWVVYVCVDVCVCPALCVGFCGCVNEHSSFGANSFAASFFALSIIRRHVISRPLPAAVVAYLSVCLFVWLSVWMSGCLSDYFAGCIIGCLCLSVCPPVWLSDCLNLWLSVCLAGCLFVSLACYLVMFLWHSFSFFRSLPLPSLLTPSPPFIPVYLLLSSPAPYFSCTLISCPIPGVYRTFAQCFSNFQTSNNCFTSITADRCFSTSAYATCKCHVILRFKFCSIVSLWRL